MGLQGVCLFSFSFISFSPVSPQFYVRVYSFYNPSFCAEALEKRKKKKEKRQKALIISKGCFLSSAKIGVHCQVEKTTDTFLSYFSLLPLPPPFLSPLSVHPYVHPSGFAAGVRVHLCQSQQECRAGTALTDQHHWCHSRKLFAVSFFNLGTCTH